MKRNSTPSSDRIFYRTTARETSNVTSRSTNSINSNQATNDEDQDGDNKTGNNNLMPGKNFKNSCANFFDKYNFQNGDCAEGGVGGNINNNNNNKLVDCLKGHKDKILDSNIKQINYGTWRDNNNHHQFNNKKYDSKRRDHCVIVNDGDGGGGGGPPNDSNKNSDKHVLISDIIGAFGLFQMTILLFSGLREGLVGYDALIMSIILQPETNFLCADNLTAGQLTDLLPSTTENGSMLINNQPWNETAQCFRSRDDGLTPLLDSNQDPIKCQNWLFFDESAARGSSLVAQWSLVCHNHWLVAFIESAYFFGLVTGNLVWGYYADKVGRRPAYLMAHTISLVFGSLTVIMPSIWLFTLCRFLSAFGSIGYNIIYSIQVEIIGKKHRSFSTIMNHLGWGLGVIMVPVIDHLFDDYRPILAMVPIFTLLMFPWAFWLPESSRWLMANDKFAQAKQELIRAAKFNGVIVTPQLEKKISALEHKIRQDKIVQKQMNSNKRSYQLIFSSPSLARDTFILAYISFLGHMFYYVLTINFAYVKNLSTEANFIISGAGEWVSVCVGAVLLKFFSRKTCMSLFLFLMASSFIFQSLVDSETVPALDTPFIITANNGIGTLSALLLVFIVLIVNQEVYPTIVRQTGTSITNTLGESGSTLAPLLIQMSRLVGLWRADIFHAAICAIGMVAVQFVTKTDDIELRDT